MTAGRERVHSPEDVEAIARAFVGARRERRVLSAYPGPVPVTMAEAYRIQNAALAIDGRPVGGWKVGRIDAERAEQLGTNRLAGPIFTDSIVGAGAGEGPEMPVFAEGFAAVEAEFLLRIAPGWAGDVPDSDADIITLVDAVHAGIEVASSPYAGINRDGPPVTASDFGNNFGLVVGPPLDIADALEFNAVGVRLEIDGGAVGADSTANMLDGPIGAVRFLLNNLRERNIVADAGFWVSTGAVTGVHEVRPGANVRAVFESMAEVSCRITHA